MPDIRSKLSKNNKYYIPNHRVLELRHFCLQYPEWRKELANINYYGSGSIIFTQHSEIKNPTFERVQKSEKLRKRIEMIEQTAIKTDPDLYSYILIGVTEGVSYDIIACKYGIPCSRDMYYDRYRRFFWLLDQIRE